MEFPRDGVANMPGVNGWLRYAGHATATIEQFDEQVRLTSPDHSFAGMPVVIELSDGRLISCEVGSDGLLPRIETEEATVYHIFWGDDALAKTEGAK